VNQQVEDLLERMPLDEKSARITAAWNRKRDLDSAVNDFDLWTVRPLNSERFRRRRA
jgi:hypothetical protein